MAGSIGDGKDRVPTPHPSAAAGTDTLQPATTPDARENVDSAYQKFQTTTAARETNTPEQPTQPPLDLADHNIDTSYPFPQDMPIGKVTTVVDLVHAGDVTDQDLAWSLDVSTQQGNYAANAAGYLGLIHRDKDTIPHTLSLTTAGEAFRNSEPAERIRVLSHLINQMSADDVSERGYSDSTTEYRQETAKRWEDRVTAPEAEEAIRSTADQAVQRTHSTTRPTRTRPRRSEPQYTMCPRCYLALPATGICSDCDG